MADEALIRCSKCPASAMRREEQVKHPDGQAHLDIYVCGDCGLKAVLWWELTRGSLTGEVKSWVEAEVMKKGFFFPGDY